MSLTAATFATILAAREDCRRLRRNAAARADHDSVLAIERIHDALIDAQCVVAREIGREEYEAAARAEALRNAALGDRAIR